MEKHSTLRIAICGAGIAGLCTATQLQKQLQVYDYTVFEADAEVGGTWLQNTYPGCACDIPTHFYSFSFEENPNWSHLFCSQAEVLEYLKNLARKYDIYKNIKFQHQVVKTVWDEGEKFTRLFAKNKDGIVQEYIFDIVFYCVGGLRIPQIPEEFDGFKGPKIHSAQWDGKISLEGKNVAVVGTGASAVQIIPEIVHKVNKLYVYQRNAPWVIPRPQLKIPSAFKWTLARVPGVQKFLRFILFWVFQMIHFAFKKSSILGKTMESLAKLYLIVEFPKDEKMRDQLLPKYPFGVKRPLMSNNYYKALKQSNVHLNNNKITKVKSNSIETEDGKEAQVDVVILATGFRVLDYMHPTQAFGKGGVDIWKVAREEVSTGYLGLCNSKGPNSFYIVGPNGPSGSTSYIFSVECAVNYVIKVIKEMQRQGCRAVRVDESVEKQHMKRIMGDMEKMVWSYDYPSWYRDNEKGVVVVMCPYSGLRLWKDTLTPKFKHFIFEK